MTVTEEPSFPSSFHSVANALRRIMIAEVPTMGMRDLISFGC